MKITAILYIMLIGATAFAQNATTLEHNNTRATLSTNGTFFFDPVTNEAGYEVPKDSGIKAVYSMRFHYAAKTQQDSILLCLGGLTPQGTDVQAGPYRTTHSYDSTYTNMHDGVYWEICQEEIDTYRIWWEACNGQNADPNDCVNVTTPSNAILDKIYSWPVHGNTLNGENYFQAPYFDHPESSNGVYDPSNGDYPLIKGCCATYFVQNDDVTHSNSGTAPIGIETHYMFYHFKNWGTLNNVTFAEVKIRNLSSVDYQDFNYGVYLDMDLGNPFDDYFGSDSTLSMLFSYNADNLDEDNAPALGYGVDPPAFGLASLDQAATTALIPMVTNTPVEVWNQMNGIYPNGTAIVNPQGDTTKFLFNGNPHFMSSWSEENLGSVPSDRRGLLTTQHGPFMAGDEIVQTYAFVYSRTGNRLENVDQLYADVAEVHAFYDTIANAHCEDGILTVEKLTLNDFVVAPNPASATVTIFADAEMNFDLQVFDASGKQVSEAVSSKFGELTFDVSAIENGVYLLVLTSDDQQLTKRLVVAH